MVTNFVKADILRFAEDDDLTLLRQKIKRNGYDFRVGHNWVFDLSPAFKKQIFGRTKSVFSKQVKFADFSARNATNIPNQYDLRNLGGHSYIGPVRNQGNCGACYAFAACAAAESAFNLTRGRFDDNAIDLSEAYIAFCLGPVYPGINPACNSDGSDYEYDEFNGLVEYGICKEEDYPYYAYTQNCQAPPDPELINFISWARLPCGDITAIQTAILLYGAVAAAVNAIGAFSAYQSGIYEDAQTSCHANPCYYTETNHIIALVGWNDNNGQGYWIARNSWGAGWGENGYMRIKYHSARVACETCYIRPEPPDLDTAINAARIITGLEPINGIISGNLILDQKIDLIDLIYILQKISGIKK